MSQNYDAFLNALADEAAVIAKQYFRQPLHTELKADASPVTIADQEIEMALVARIRQAFPEDGILGEETARINPESPRQWVIDPIDGTRAFIAGKPTFVTLIALCEQGAPTVGLISQPISGKRWIGSTSSVIASESEAIPLTSNIGLPRQPVGLLAMTALAEARIATTSIPYFSAAEAAAFARLEKASASVLLNHDGLAAGLLADGELEILIESGLKPYDFCALVPVIEQAGGVITDWQGQPLTISSGGQILAAANAGLHHTALALLQNAANDIG